MIPYSILDLAPIPEGREAGEALHASADLARHAEGCGYRRFWLAEHHSMPGIASAATAVCIANVAAATKTIRVGAGGVMLPNHAPLVVAEQFGTLESLHPGRIDLGLGRAPGSDGMTMRALRRRQDRADDFPGDVAELMRFLGPADPRAHVQAVPGQGTNVPIWILGSSLYGAQFAAAMGLPYAFASHFAPDALGHAAQIYRDTFQPSEQLQEPHFMMAINVFAGADDAEGMYLRTSSQQAFANLRLGRPGKLPRPVEDIEAVLPGQVLGAVNHALGVAAVGGPETVRRDLAAIIDAYRPDEVIFASAIHDAEARKRSVTIAAEAMQALGAEAAA
ncbi:LLM class flavin-dependent oxidoreductase [Rhodovulum sp. DZ06]|uniref:LLM class flavin-dependent oxidoreductase n=1 Tax=Rhodovulum sp. DZ06 TaxID=3425126 RepID=UPI003D33C136